jgi:hypothetical protein
LACKSKVNADGIGFRGVFVVAVAIVATRVPRVVIAELLPASRKGTDGLEIMLRFSEHETQVKFSIIACPSENASIFRVFGLCISYGRDLSAI